MFLTSFDPLGLEGEEVVRVLSHIPGTELYIKGTALGMSDAQSVCEAAMEGKTQPGQSLNFFFFTNLCDFLLCIKSPVIIQPLCHEFFIVAVFCLNAKWSMAA